MIIKFTYGIEHKGWLFGWHKKELYRLDNKSFNRYYPLKKLSKIMVGNNLGYRLKRDKFSIQQLEAKTIMINREVSVIKSKDLPFF